jgi:HEAT repeat protein
MCLREQVYRCLRVLRFSMNLEERERTQRELLGFAGSKVIEVLSKIMLTDPDPEMQGYAARALVEIAPERASKLIVPLLESPEPILREDICGLLSKCGDEKAVAPLMEVLQNDRDADVRFLAAFALGKIGDRRAIPALEWARRHDDGMDFDGHPVRNAAEDAINEILARYPGAQDSDKV